MTLSTPPRLTAPLVSSLARSHTGAGGSSVQSPASFQSAADGEAMWGETAQRPCSALLGSGDSHLGGAGQRHFWAFLQAMAGTSSCEKS